MIKNYSMNLLLIAGITCHLGAMENNGKNPVRNEDEVKTHALSSDTSKDAVYNQPLFAMSEGVLANICGIIDIGIKIQNSGSRTASALSPDGNWLATGSHDGEVKITDITTGEIIYQDRYWSRPYRGERGGDTVKAIAFSLDGKRIAAGYSDRIVQIHDIETRQHVGEIAHNRDVNFLSFFPGVSDVSINRFPLAIINIDEKKLRFDPANNDETILRFIDCETKQTVCQIRHNSNITGWTSMYSNSSSKLVGTSSSDGTVRVTDITTGETVFEMNDRPADALRLWINGNMLLIASGYEIRVIDITTSKTLFETKSDSKFNSLDFESKVLVAHLDKEVRLIDVTTGQIVAIKGIQDATLLRDGKRLMIHDLDNCTTRIVDLSVIQGIWSTATLNTYELLSALQLAARDTKELPRNQCARIHASDEQWNTWLQLRSAIPHLEKFIVRDGAENNVPPKN